MARIVNKFPLNHLTDWIEIEAPKIAKNYESGQFIILRIDDVGERIPLTVVDTTDTTITLIVQKIGDTTKQLGQLTVGDDILDVVGPLGNPIHFHDVSRIVAIGGGVGAAPLYPQLKAYHARGVSFDCVLGAKSKDLLILENEFDTLCDTLIITTDDGSKGIKGFVTDGLNQLLQKNTYDHAIAIGPLIMMKHCVNLNKAHHLQTDVSLNPIMIDGTGMCGNCRVTIHNETYFACIDGPDFLGDGIDFDELMVRQSSSKEPCQLRRDHND
jgi:ferredoxin--NADP+ reductase